MSNQWIGFGIIVAVEVGVVVLVFFLLRALSWGLRLLVMLFVVAFAVLAGWGIWSLIFTAPQSVPVVPPPTAETVVYTNTVEVPVLQTVVVTAPAVVITKIITPVTGPIFDIDLNVHGITFPTETPMPTPTATLVPPATLTPTPTCVPLRILRFEDVELRPMNTPEP